MHIAVISEGLCFSLYGLVVDNVCIISEYVDSLTPKDSTQLFALFDHILKMGPPNNATRFNPIGDGVYELKTKSGVRILCFYAPSNLQNSLILTHGFKKPKSRVLQREKAKTLKWFTECHNLKDIRRHIIDVEKKS
jgi:phage-related protein